MGGQSDQVLGGGVQDEMEEIECPDWMALDQDWIQVTQDIRLNEYNTNGMKI